MKVPGRRGWIADQKITDQLTAMTKVQRARVLLLILRRIRTAKGKR